MSSKQIIVMRTDLNMRKGKMVAQGCHASLKIFFDRLNSSGGACLELGPLDSWDWYNAVLPWVNGAFTKVCVGVGSEEELLQIVKLAKEANIPAALIQDSGKTEFGGVPTYTCCAVGPDLIERIDTITGHLKLL